MRDGGDILRVLPPFQNKKDVLARFQTTDDIVRELLKYQNIYEPDYDKISDRFWKGNARATANYLYNFLSRNVQYDIEPNTDQTIKSPAAILSQRLGDCKHYSSFVCGVVDSLKRKGKPISARYRFASYNPYKKNPHHVFSVVSDKNGNDYWTDPVLPTFDNRKQPNHSYDKKISDMPLSSVSGISDEPGELGRRKNKGGVGGKKKKPRTPRKEKKQKKRAEKKQRRADRKKDKCKVNPIKKVGLAAARNSFLLLLRMNLFRKASKLYSKLKDNKQFQDELYKKWCKAGGNPYSLKKSINQGVRVWNKHHKNKKLEGELHGTSNEYGWDMIYQGVYVPGVGEVSFGCDCDRSRLGLLPVVAAGGALAVIAAAMPIIKMVAGMFKKHGIETDDLTSKGREGNEMLEDATDDPVTAMEEVDDSSNADFMDDELVSSEGDNVPGDYDADPIEAYQEENIEGVGFLRFKKKKKAATPATPNVKKQRRVKVNIPLSKQPKKVKTKTVNRAPFITVTRTTTPAIKRQGKIVKPASDVIRIPKVSYNLEKPNDPSGTNDIFQSAKDWYLSQKEWVNPVGGTLLGLAVASAFSGTKRRR